MSTIVLFLINFLPLIIALSYAMSGWRKGAVWEILNIVRFFAAFFSARAFSGPLASWFVSLPWVSSWEAGVADSAATAVSDKTYNIIGATQTTSAVSTGIYFVCVGIAFILIMWLVSFLIGRVMWMTLGVNKIPIIGTLNRLGGSAAGLVYGLLVALILYTLLQWASSAFGWTDLNLYLNQSWWSEMIATYGVLYGL